jgi:serine/threonine-protein kinase
MSAESGLAEAWKTLADAEARRDPLMSVRPSAPLRATVSIMTLPTVRIAHGAGDDDDDAELQVTGVLGEGGMGRVLLARQRALHRDVAVKVVGESATAEAAGALVAEGVVAGSLEHPNVVPVHALGLDAMGKPVLVMKRIEGVSLGDLVRDESHPMWSSLAPTGERLEAKIELVMAACNAIHFAHSRGIVHRDLKPDNVMLGSFGEVYVVDWGVALRVDDSSPTFENESSGLVGTPAFMAPEMARGDHARIGPRTDVFLLGATLHAALTGEPRHVGDSLYSVLFSALHVAPFDYPVDVPAELAAICNRATHVDPEARFATAMELRRALEAFRRHRGSIGLAEEAAHRLKDALGARTSQADRHRIDALLTESRFGFAQALRDWPDNARARAGLEECLVAMLELELERRDEGGARALLGELAEPRPHLSSRIDALAQELAAARDAERDRDMSIGAGAQLAVLGAMPAVASFALVFLATRGKGPLGPVEILAPPIVALALLGIVVFAVRKRLTTSTSRKAIAGIIMIPAVATVHRALELRLGQTLVPIGVGDLVMITGMLGTMSLLLSRRIVPAAVASLVGAVALTARPDLGLPIFAASLVSTLVLLVRAWREIVRAPRP